MSRHYRGNERHSRGVHYHPSYAHQEYEAEDMPSVHIAQQNEQAEAEREQRLVGEYAHQQFALVPPVHEQAADGTRNQDGQGVQAHHNACEQRGLREFVGQPADDDLLHPERAAEEERGSPEEAVVSVQQGIEGVHTHRADMRGCM